MVLATVRDKSWKLHSHDPYDEDFSGIHENDVKGSEFLKAASRDFR